jgi:levansucrase
MAVTTTRWTREQVAAFVDDPATWTPVIPDEGLPRLVEGTDFWDLWAVRTVDGAVADVGGREVWAGLSAPAVGHPGARHDEARIRLIARRPDGGWDDLGPLFPDGASAGSREWAGSLVYDPVTQTITAYYSAAGYRGELEPTFRQRIFMARASVRMDGDRPVLESWTEHTEAVVSDGVRYTLVDQVEGEPGFIKAFRDPFPFRDPATGTDYLLFTGSIKDAETDFNGCVGLARLGPDGYELLDPLVTADGVNNELERPHVVVHEGRYLLFFSTQARTFHHDVTGPTGLYGFAAQDFLGPYEPFNGSGLVLRNPPGEPFQAYSWLVLPDLTTTAFVDSFALHGVHPEQLETQGTEAVRAHFGGTMTPASQVRVEGLRAWVEPA